MSAFLIPPNFEQIPQPSQAELFGCIRYQSGSSSPEYCPFYKTGLLDAQEALWYGGLISSAEEIEKACRSYTPWNPPQEITEFCSFPRAVDWSKPGRSKTCKCRETFRMEIENMKACPFEEAAEKRLAETGKPQRCVRRGDYNVPFKNGRLQAAGCHLWWDAPEE
jgi:hypothetical protein